MSCINRKFTWFSCLILSSAAGLLPATGKHPNILRITAENISPNPGCYGDLYAVTPHLDHFAR